MKSDICKKIRRILMAELAWTAQEVNSKKSQHCYLTEARQ